MQRVKKSLGEHLPPVKIYREDIEEIFAILKDESDEFSLKADGYIFESLDELFTYKKDQINSLEMQIRNPYTSIHFSPNQIWLYADDNSSLQIGLYEQIKQIVTKRKNWPFILVTSPYLIGLWGGLGLQPIIFYNKTDDFSYYLAASAIIYLTTILWWRYNSKIKYKQHSQVILSYKKDKNISFIKRNKDNLIIATLGIIGSGILSYLIK